MASSKLTLSMEPEVVYRAKKYAKQRKTSLSKLVENFLDELSKQQLATETTEIDTDILKLTGILKGKVADNINLKAERNKYLKEKHGL